MSKDPTTYRVVGGSHDGEIFPYEPAEPNPNEKAELTGVFLPHLTEPTLREVYVISVDEHGEPILRLHATLDASLASSDFLPVT